MTVEVSKPYGGMARLKFSTGLRVDIIDKTGKDGKPRLYINVAGHDEDMGRETIYIRPESGNSFSIFFDTFEPDPQR